MRLDATPEMLRDAVDARIERNGLDFTHGHLNGAGVAYATIAKVISSGLVSSLEDLRGVLIECGMATLQEIEYIESIKKAPSA